MRYALSVSIGEKETAIAILRRVERDRNSREVPDHWLVSTQDIFVQRLYHLIHLEKLTNNYAAIISRLAEHLKKLELEDITRLLVDTTVSGSSILQAMKEEQIVPHAMRRTTSSQVVKNKLGYAVPEQDIITSLKVLFQTKRIKMPAKLVHLDEFTNDLQNYDLGLTAEEWREDGKSVLVLSVAQAAWYFNKVYRNNVLKQGRQKETGRDWNPFDRHKR